jgi:hypothetical protein
MKHTVKREIGYQLSICCGKLKPLKALNQLEKSKVYLSNT